MPCLFKFENILVPSMFVDRPKILHFTTYSGIFMEDNSNSNVGAITGVTEYFRWLQNFQETRVFDQ